MLTSCGQGGDRVLSGDGTFRPIGEQVNVGPISHERGVATLKNLPAIFFRIRGLAPGRNGS